MSDARKNIETKPIKLRMRFSFWRESQGGRCFAEILDPVPDHEMHGTGWEIDNFEPLVVHIEVPAAIRRFTAMGGTVTHVESIGETNG